MGPCICRPWALLVSAIIYRFIYNWFVYYRFVYNRLAHNRLAFHRSASCRLVHYGSVYRSALILILHRSAA